MKPRKSFLLRINPELFEALEAWSQQDLRSVNGQIEFLLKEAVDRRRRDRRAESTENIAPPAEPETGSADQNS